MDGVHPHFTVRTCLGFLLLILLQTSTKAVPICYAESSVQIAENNVVGAVVATITVLEGVTLELTSLNQPLSLRGNELIATRVLDYETETNYPVKIKCTETATSRTLEIPIVVLVTNENDNPPVFDQNPHHIRVDEMSPIGTSVGNFAATDLDPHTQIFYKLMSESNYFGLQSSTTPNLVIATLLDYDKFKNVPQELVLLAQDTPLTATDISPSFTGTTTIMVTILDVDNRPPWFQPCEKHEAGLTVICHNSGYTGRVVLNERETGVLPLKPGPLYAIDGDSGINELVTYSFLGYDGDVFEINANSGNISMLKPVNMVETIILTVMAAQTKNSNQFAHTTVTIQVQQKSNHPPEFQRPLYNALITQMGTMALDKDNKNKLLQISATDRDYIDTEGINPYITYSINGSNDFFINDGYLFMTKDLPETTLSLDVVATDTTNDEFTTAQLSVTVATGLTTTTLPLSTTDIMTFTTETADISVSTNIPVSTSGSLITMTSEETISPASTEHPFTELIPSGDYGLIDMAALGVTLGVLLFICLVVIGVLVYRMRRGKADWRKIYEASMFRSSLGQGSGGVKEGIQYTNEAFQNDEDGGSMDKVGVIAGGEPQKAVGDILLKDAIERSPEPVYALLDDDVSQAGSDKADNEKEVKPILTKEKRMEEGYKSVWFKEDIDPNAKEEVVIIPDSREDDSEDEEEEEGEEPSSSNREEEEDDNSLMKTPKVIFADADSGLGVRMGDMAEDSDDYEKLTTDL